MSSTGWMVLNFTRLKRTPKAIGTIELGEADDIVHVMTRRKFLGTTIAGSATMLAGTVFQKLALAVTTSATQSTFQLGGDLAVNRLGFGAMRLTGEGIWGWPPDRENAKKVLRRAVELGVNFHRHGGVPLDGAAPQRPKSARNLRSLHPNSWSFPRKLSGLNQSAAD